eukprot:jgi/Botrbrau1/4051/Bobra.152_3s0008.1
MRFMTPLACMVLAALCLTEAASSRSLQTPGSKHQAHRKASAPSSLAHIAGSGAPEPSTAEDIPDFAGKPLTKPPARKQAVPGDVPFPVNDANQLVDLTEKQLWSIFTRGVADNPSTLPGEKGKFVVCPNDVLMVDSYTRPEALAQGGLPGLSDVFNTLNHLWNGKALYTPPNSNETQLWNLMLSNTTVDVIGKAYVKKGGVSKDGKDSLVLSYRNTDNVFLRPMLDEMRRVGPSVWLGRMWIDNLVESWKPNDLPPAASPWVDDFLAPLANSTLKAALSLGGQPYVVPEVPLGNPVPIIYFAVECVDQPVPQLQYVPIANVTSEIDKLTGFHPFEYQLPGLPKERGSDGRTVVDTSEGGSKAEGTIESQAASAPAPAPDAANPLVQAVAWPLATLSNQTLFVPSSMLAPMFGSSWAMNSQAAMSPIPGLDQLTSATSAISTAFAQGIVQAGNSITNTIDAVTNSTPAQKVDADGKPVASAAAPAPVAAKKTSAKKKLAHPPVESR